MTCAQIALALSILGAVGVGVIFSMGGVTFYGGRVHFRNIRWRLSCGRPGPAFSSVSRSRRSFADRWLTASSRSGDRERGRRLPWLCINRVLRVMLQIQWSAEACASDRAQPGPTRR